MAEPWKNHLSPALVGRLADALAAAWPPFPRHDFERRACTGLDALELKARADHIATALDATLPAEPAEAMRVVTATFGPPLTVTSGYGTDVWRLYPFSAWLHRNGPRDVPAALAANRELTMRFTAEFSIRALLRAAPDATLAALAAWADDPNPHVRRLVSEGTRTRLPWGERLPQFIRDPAPVLALLERLKDDPEEYVRRSVANNLNDLSKDHPELVLALARRWLEDAGPLRRRLVAHALRSLVKAGNREALGLAGADAGARLEVEADVSPKRVKVGGAFTVTARVRNRGRRAARVVAEACIHFVGTTRTGVRTFRIRRVDIPAGATVELTRTFALVDRSIRRLHPGRHVVEVQVNGRRWPAGSFHLAR